MTATKGGTIKPITAADLSLVCSPDNAQAPVGSQVSITCTWTGAETLGARSVVLSSISIPAPSGWQISSDAAHTVVNGRTLTVTPNHTITSKASSAYSIVFRLIPDCSAGTAASPFVVSSGLLDGSTSLAGPSRTVNVTRAASAGSVSVALLDATDLDWTTSYSFDDQVLTGALAYEVASGHCGNWNVQISATDFVSSGPVNGATIPNELIALDSLGTLDSPLIVSTGSGVGTQSQQLGVTVTVPGFAPIGSYTSTITVTASTAP